MSANTDKVKGRANNADGDHANNDDRKRGGRSGRKLDKAKDVVDSINEAARELLEGVENTVQTPGEQPSWHLLSGPRCRAARGVVGPTTDFRARATQSSHGEERLAG